MNVNNNTVIRIPAELYKKMIEDLNRPHPFAAERVGFLAASFLQSDSNSTIITITGYHTVPDEDYIDDKEVGASINTNAIRREMQEVIRTGHGCLHVHLHNHAGKPYPSITDKKSLPDVSRSFLNANPAVPCGYLILSEDNFYCALYDFEKTQPAFADQFTIVGYPSEIRYAQQLKLPANNEVFERQSFLGTTADQRFGRVKVGLVGLGGGGSHIAQQLAHVGIIHCTNFDADHIEWSNLNRLIGGRFKDIGKKLKKIKIIERLMKGINPYVKLKSFNTRWQEHPEELNNCDFVIGCVDSLSERMQLESACRRALIPYIDIGMDVHQITGHGFSMSGQVILSMPGMPCMQCFKFVTEANLSEEAKRYGDAGGRPQVVWPNGVLASTAVGVLIDLITGWANLKNRKVYLSYDGDNGHITDHPHGIYSPAHCTHYPLHATGEVIFNVL